jgi:hypothetical protein
MSVLWFQVTVRANARVIFRLAAIHSEFIED